ncbi:hypothetical protein QYF36_010531 [Acer negundo]|nr:hypothetical protein QYF36_010531 [Acer negundo]
MRCPKAEIPSLGSGKDVGDIFFDCATPNRRFIGSMQASGKANGAGIDVGKPVQPFLEVNGNRCIDKEKGSWIKKARVKRRIIYDKTAKVVLDKRDCGVVRREDSKSSSSTSSDSKGIVWMGECSRSRLYVGPQSLSLDLILKTHSSDLKYAKSSHRTQSSQVVLPGQMRNGMLGNGFYRWRKEEEGRVVVKPNINYQMQQSSDSKASLEGLQQMQSSDDGLDVDGSESGESRSEDLQQDNKTGMSATMD